MLPAVGRAPGGPVAGSTLVAAVPAVGHPLAHAAADVADAEWICLEQSDRCGFGRVVRPATALAICHPRYELRPPPIGSGGPAACRILPFRLARQPIGLGCDLGQPCHILLSVIPTDIRDG